MPEEEGSTIGHRLRDEIDIAGLALEIEGLVRAPETEEGRTLGRKIGSSKLRRPKLKVLYPIQAILPVTFQRCIINTRYKQLSAFDGFMNKMDNCLINYID